MTPIKTYIATIKVTFEAYEKENPRAIAKHMADYYNGMRGANLHAYSVMQMLVEEANGKTIKKNLHK